MDLYLRFMPIIEAVAEKLQQDSAKQNDEVIEAVSKLPQFIDDLLASIKYYGSGILAAIIITLILKRLTKFLVKVTTNTLERSRVDEGVCKFVVSFLRTICYIGICFVFIGLASRGKLSHATVATATAVIGSAGLTVGLALQGSLQNFSGGVLILLLKPFKIGDYIIAQGYEGTVQTIEIFYTKLLTIDNRMVVLPNGVLSNTNITNVTREDIRRLDLLVGIEYSEDVRRVKAVLTRIAESKELVLKDHDIMVFVNDFLDSSVSMGLRVWCKTEDYWPLRWDILESIKVEFDREGIVIPFNQLDVNVRQAVEEAVKAGK